MGLESLLVQLKGRKLVHDQHPGAKSWLTACAGAAHPFGTWAWPAQGLQKVICQQSGGKRHPRGVAKGGQLTAASPGPHLRRKELYGAFNSFYLKAAQVVAFPCWRTLAWMSAAAHLQASPRLPLQTARFYVASYGAYVKRLWRRSVSYSR